MSLVYNLGSPMSYVSDRRVSAAILAWLREQGADLWQMVLFFAWEFECAGTVDHEPSTDPACS